LKVLTQFHREVVLPDIERIVYTKLDERFDSLRNEMLTNFDAVFQRLDRLETEYQSLRIAVERLEARVTAIERKIDKLALRSEVVDLKERIVKLEARLAELDADL